LDRWDILVRRDDLACEIRPAQAPTLRPGEIRLAVECFGLTSINITYASLPDCPIPFLDLFPAPEGYGRVPVWGFARVEESAHPGVEVGDRLFGYLPMSSHHTLSVEPADDGVVMDVTPHRATLHSWYRTLRVAGPADAEDGRKAVVRPIYPASYTLAAFLAEHAAAGARTVVVTSASSKTAIGMADQLVRQGTDLRTIALTSPANVDFVAGLGLYGTVAAYDDLPAIEADGPVVFVDFTGTAKRLAAVYERFAGRLRHTALVGYTHPGAVVRQPDLGEPTPVIFFSPGVEERAAAAEGRESYFSRYFEAEERFVGLTRPWLDIEEHRGPDAIVALFRALVAGRVPPSQGNSCVP
jgi:hypothetical protein